MARGPLTPTASRNVFMFVMRIRPPTALPRIRAGRMRTMYAAIGAAITPPKSRAPTMVHGISAKLRAKRNPMLALRATRNSLVSTVPMIFRGCIRPEESNVGVAIGPTPAAGSVEEPGNEAQRSQEASGDRPLSNRPLVPPERKPGEHEDTKGEQEDRDDRLRRLRGDERAQYHRTKKGPYRTRYGQRPHLRPVHVAEPPVRGA